jgi:hypothetical protein
MLRQEKPRVCVHLTAYGPASGCVGKSQQVTVSDPVDKIQAGTPMNDCRR